MEGGGKGPLRDSLPSPFETLTPKGVIYKITRRKVQLEKREKEREEGGGEKEERGKGKKRLRPRDFCTPPVFVMSFQGAGRIAPGQWKTQK